MKLITLDNLKRALNSFYDKIASLYATIDDLESGLASKAPLSHTTDTTVHITAAERTGFC